MKPKLLGLMVAAALAIPVHAMAQDTTPPQDDANAATPAKKVVAKDAQQMQTVTVTGSLIPRAQIEGPSPTTTVTADDIQAKGFSNVFEALRALPQANGSVEDAQFTGGYTPGAKTISLLGLSPAYTLTLLNGRPMASYPLAYDGGTNIVDIANIPMGMVDHIDVLTGGQSSIYGSSAIAGVVNIVLKDHVEGTHMALRMGGYTDGGGDSQRFQISSGHKWGDLDVSAGLQFEKDSPIWAYQRSYIDSYYDDPTGKNAVPSRTFLRLDETPGATGYIDPGAATCAPLSYMYGGSTAYSYRSGAGLGHYCGSANNVSYTTLANKDGAANGTLFLRYHLTPDTELYSDILYSFSDPTYSGGSPFWNKTFYNQTSGKYEEWQRILAPEEVGLDAQDQHVFTRSYNAAFGIRGGIGDSGFDYDIYYNRSQSDVTRKSIDFYAQNGIDDYYLGPQLGMSEGYPIYAPNLSKLYQPLSLAEYQKDTGIDRSTSMAWTQNVTATVNNTALFQLPAGNVGFAAIVQASNERFDNHSADPNADTLFRGVTAATQAKGSRKLNALGAEFQVPIFSNLNANVSARYDKYSYDGGGNGKLTYKLGLEYRPLDTLLVRGSYATAFRAPDMFYLFSGQTGGYSTVTDYTKCRQQGFNSSNYDNCAQSGQSILSYHTGNTALKDITAKTYTYGFVWSPTNKMSLSIDYNAVDIDNEVVVLDADTIAQTEADCRLGVSENGDTTYDINSPTCKEVLGEVIRKPATDPINPNGIDTINTYPINVAHSRQTGIQSSFDYRWDFTGYGNFAFSAGYYDALTHTTQQKAGDPTYNLLCCANSDELKSRFNASLTWNVGKWSSTLYGLRNGRSWNSVGTEKDIGPWIVFNGSVRYQLNKQASMLVSVNNIANKRPPIDSTNGNWPYYDTGIYNALGREVMAELHLDFGG